jgi:hypothetical protein
MDLGSKRVERERSNAVTFKLSCLSEIEKEISVGLDIKLGRRDLTITEASLICLLSTTCQGTKLM